MDSWSPGVISAPIPVGEACRLAALTRYGVLDSAPEPGFDDLARLAAMICGAPIGLVSLIDAERQLLAGCIGLDPAEAIHLQDFWAQIGLTPDRPVVIPDALQDHRFARNRLVAGAPHLRFCSAVSLTAPDGSVVGALAVLDHLPRLLSSEQLDCLKTVARQVAAQLELRGLRRALATVGEPGAVADSGPASASARAEEALRESEARFRSMADASPLGIFVTDGAGQCLYVNRAWEALAGMEHDYALHWGWTKALHPDDRDRVREHWEQCCREQTVYTCEQRFVRPDGAIVWVSVKAAPFLDRDRLLGWVGTVADITDQRRAEDALRASEARLRRLTENLPAGAVYVEGNAILFNRAVEAITGLDRDEVRTLDEWFARLYGAEAATVRALYQADRRAGFPEPRVVPITRPDGSRRFVEFAAYADDRVEVWLLIDVTERAEAEERFWAQFEGSSHGQVLFDETGIIDCNNAALQGLHCADKRDVLGLDPARLSPELQPDGRRSREKSPELDRLARSKGTHHFEWVHRRIDGEEFPAEVTLFPVFVNGRDMLLWVWNELTDQKRAEEVLRKTTASLQAIVDFSPLAICTVDREGTVLTWNPAAEQVFGWTAGESIGRELLIVPPDDREPARAMWDRVFAGETFAGLEARRLRKDGTLADVALSASPVRDRSGAVTSIMFMYLDVTARKRNEERMRLLSSVVERSTSGVVITDPELRITYVNPAFEALSGYSLAEVVGRHPGELLQGPDTDPAARSELRAAILERRPVTVEILNYRRDGQPYWIELGLAPVFDAGGRLTSFVAIESDVTARRASEAELQRYYEEVERSRALAEDQARDMAALAEELSVARNTALESVRVKSAFLATMSHEIRTPMNGVIGMTGLLLDTELTRAQRAYAEAVRSSGETLLNLINDILDFSKIEAGKLALEQVDFDLRASVEDVLELLAERAQGKGLELAGIVTPSVPDLVRGDPGRLRQVLTNLLGNAVKFTDTGDVVLTVQTVAGPDGGSRLRFDIADSGIGISPEGLARLFQAFSQADGSTTRKYGGTGLGLAISKQIVELMGGEIGATSLPGEGSTFWFTIPLAAAAEGAAAAPPARPDLSRVRVLCVENHPAVCEAVAAELGACGAAVDFASGGMEAFSLLHQAASEGQPYRLVAVDRHLPAPDGLALARAIKADAALAGTAVVLLGSWTHREADAALREAGVRTVITKPVRLSALRDAVATALDLPRAGGDTGATPTGSADCEELSLRILVAEDNKVNQEVAKHTLKKLGHRVDVVANGHEAVEALQRIPYDLVLMDCQMPELDGYGATQAIRRCDGPARYVPIIAMTANAMRGDRERCLAAGMDDYIAKPFPIETLRSMLRLWAPASARRREETGPAPVPAPTPSSAETVDPDTIAALRELESADAPGFLAELIGLFIDDLSRRLEAIANGIAQADSAATAAAAHSLKGGAANLGARPLAALCEQLEVAGKAGSLEAAELLLGAIRTESTRARTRLEQEIRPAA